MSPRSPVGQNESELLDPLFTTRFLHHPRSMRKHQRKLTFGCFMSCSAFRRCASQVLATSVAINFSVSLHAEAEGRATSSRRALPLLTWETDT